MRILAALLSFVILFAAGCGTETEKTKEAEDAADENDTAQEDYETIIPANNELGFKLFPEIAEEKEENIFISPTSLFMTLSMLYSGADSETKREIAKTIDAKEIDSENLDQANAALLSDINKKAGDVQLNIANSLWLHDDFHFQEDFAQNSKDYFHADTEKLDINDDKTPEKINDWVKESTNNKIDEIVDAPLNDDLIAFIINAIYFKGNWTHKFDTAATEDDAFHLANGDKKDVPFMKLTEDLKYMENDDFQAVSLPYGKEEEVSMKVFLPRKKSSLQELEQTLKSDNWDVWNSEFQAREGTISLPKFQVTYEKNFNKALKQLGMESAFNEDADFRKMIEENEPVWISQVKQKTFLDVDEEGTEADAATSAEMDTVSAPIEEDEPFEMEVNRPFFVAIVDEETEAILFMGSVYEP